LIKTEKHFKTLKSKKKDCHSITVLNCQKSNQRKSNLDIIQLNNSNTLPYVGQSKVKMLKNVKLWQGF